MPAHQDLKIVPYPADFLEKLVLDVEKYPEFLPWCLSSRVNEKKTGYMNADLVIGYRLIQERFTSHIYHPTPHRIEVTHDRGPFKSLSNLWIFTPLENESGPSCQIDFRVTFEFKSRLLSAAISPIFHKAVLRMVASFEARAAALYQKPEVKPRRSRKRI